MVAQTLRIALAGLLPALALATAPAPARAQVPQPMVPNANERSGLLTRFVPIEPTLPHDPDRDTFYDTRYGDRYEVGRPNNLFRGGLYGLRLGSDCTTCTSPYFRGAPGRNSHDAGCEMHGRYSRWWENFVHPFKPVCSYYAGGCRVPVYDLDPVVTGPGPFPFGLFFRPHPGG